MKRALVWCLPLLFAASWLQAGTLYRCVGSDGVSHISAEKVKGADCKVAARYDSPAVSQPAAAAQPANSSAAKRVEFRSAGPGQSLNAPAAGAGTVISRGAIYKYERDGVTQYTNIKPQNVSAPVQTVFSYVEACYACAALPGVDFSTVRLNHTAYAHEVDAAAREFGVDRALVRAIIHAESAFRPNAVSNKGAQGLMQLIPATAERFSVSDVFDAAQNIRGGTRYLSWLLRRFNDDTTLAAAAYNAGEGAVDRYKGVPPYPETQRYVERVTILAQRYRASQAALAVR